jgi:CRP/FNR family transcriptional regulator
MSPVAERALSSKERGMQENAIVSLLRTVPLFRGLDEPLLQQLADKCRRRRYGPNTDLFHEGDPGHVLYIIIEGQVGIWKAAEPAEMYLAERGRGEHIGEMALVDDQPRMARAVTTSSCDLLMLDRGDFLQALESSPRMALSVITALAQRLREATDQLESCQHLDVLGRVAKAIVDLAKSQGIPAADGVIHVPFTRTHQDLALQISAARESVTKALTSLRQTHVIRVEGETLCVLDLAKLRKMCRR